MPSPAALALILAGLALVALAITQIVVPKLAERRIGRRLTASGGIAEVAVIARPALRLLAAEGDLLRVRGSGMTIEMIGEGGGLTALDGFVIVEIELEEIVTGPFEVSRFELARSGRGAPYRMRSLARTSGAELLGFGGEQLGVGAAARLGALARGAPLGTRSFAVEAEVELSLAGGILEVTGGGGSIAGYPAGPVATAIAAAVARRLDVTP
jgi:hypothetical protein